jgi:hypothetical protein
MGMDEEVLKVEEDFFSASCREKAHRRKHYASQAGGDF